MKLCILLVILACFNVSAASYAQTLTLNEKNVPLVKVFQQIEAQSSYSFFYENDLLKRASPVTIRVEQATIDEVLDKCLKGQPLHYRIVRNTIVIESKQKSFIEKAKDFLKPPIKVQGKVTDENGNALRKASVSIKGTDRVSLTDDAGYFTLFNVPEEAIIVVSYLGYEKMEQQAAPEMLFTLRPLVGQLAEVLINKGYYTERKELSTGSVVKVTAADIEKQPVINPLAALQGRVPGLTVTPTNGLVGSAFRLEIRGQNTLGLANSNKRELISDPLYIIDGIPFAPNNSAVNNLTSAISTQGGAPGGLSPFSSINPQDIESIEVFKDADATAIYGSRGGNGVVLITTKKGKAGKTQFSANVYSGISQVAKLPRLMNTEAYLAMRKEAFSNNGVLPDQYNAPDLVVWDQSKYTDFPKLFIGNTAEVTNAQLALTGGNGLTNFRIGGNFNHETTVLPGDNANNRAAFQMNLNHTNSSNRLSIGLTTLYSNDVNRIISSNMASLIILEPNFPDLYKNNGDLAWTYNGTSIDNPLASLKQTYKATSNNLVSNLLVNYNLLKGLRLRTAAGYNRLTVNEYSLSPVNSLNPAFVQTASSSFGDNRFTSWSIEPQLNYEQNLGSAKLSLLLGGTWQETENRSSVLIARGFSSDALLLSPGSASNLTTSSSSYRYRYEAFFGRINYNLKDRYILNLTGRRDGSSRFGQDRQFANFGAVGAAWLFGKEAILKRLVPSLSYGKIRASFGITGTDQIGNYQFLDTWQSIAAYQNTTALTPTRLANPDYSWEKNEKAEIATELGFLDDRILLTAALFRNTSSNHLVSYTLPSQTGFTSVTRNLPAKIENRGLELLLTTRNIKTTKFLWTTAGNITWHRNRLLAFPGIETSSYNSAYTVGQSLDAIRGYQYTGVDPQTGFFTFADINGDGVIDSKDYNSNIIGNSNPALYGGFNNSLTLENWSLDFFFEFKKQYGMNYLGSLYGYLSPGGYPLNVPNNLPTTWRAPGDQAVLQKYTTGTQGADFLSAGSTLTYSDASYVRLKTLAVNYAVPKRWLTKIKLTDCRFYFQGQNLLTITRYKVTDPETQSLTVLPPLRTLTAGIQLTL